MFKTREMKKYDDFTLLYNHSVKLAENMSIPGEEKMMYGMWSFNKKINCIQNYLLKTNINLS